MLVLIAAMAYAIILNLGQHVPKLGRSITHERDYVVNLESFPSTNPGLALKSTFHQSALDGPLRAFLADAASASATTAGLLEIRLKSLLFRTQMFIGRSRPDASATVHLASLYVASPEQLSAVATLAEPAPTSLLDIGSGAGTETSKLAVALGLPRQNVTTVELSEVRSSEF